MEAEVPMRRIEEGCALEWLKASPVIAGASFVTSLPDFTEFPSLTLPEWQSWFVGAAGLVLSRCPEEGVAIFYQRDSKHEGVWVDKSYLCQKAAEAAGHSLLWHKIVARGRPGSASFGKPGYSHLLCFSRGVKAKVESSTPDLLPEAGDSTWTRGMGYAACLASVRFVATQTTTRTIVDPFCGHGSVLAVANAQGLAAVGVELSRKRAERARLVRAENGSFIFPGEGPPSR